MLYHKIWTLFKRTPKGDALTASRAVEIVEEEFEALCRDFPYLMERVSYRTIDSTLVWDLIDRIKNRIEKE